MLAIERILEYPGIPLGLSAFQLTRTVIFRSCTLMNKYQDDANQPESRHDAET